MDGITKSYGSNLALADFSVDLEAGIYALLGPNGSGKTTLMNIITDNLKADAGAMYYCEAGDELNNTRSMGRAFRQKIGYMPQYPGMYSNFTVDEFLWYIAILKNLASELPKNERKKVISKQISELLCDVELIDVRFSRIGSLSGGMKQRLGLAQALLGDPSIIVLDEPTAGLDPKQRIAIRNLISKIALNKIVIVATHVVSDIEYIARKAIVLRKGRIIDYASPDELARKMEGKVWQIRTDESKISEFQVKNTVINISREEQTGEILIRILCDSKPCETASQVMPSMEDYYLYTFNGNK